MGDKEEPYQITAINDLVANYSSDHFRYAINQCRDVIANVIAEDNRSDQQVARVRILRCLDLQLSRAIRWVEEEADLMALVVRSQIELRFWAEFVSQDRRKLLSSSTKQTSIFASFMKRWKRHSREKFSHYPFLFRASSFL
jgi:hypothetical protein